MADPSQNTRLWGNLQCKNFQKRVSVDRGGLARTEILDLGRIFQGAQLINLSFPMPLYGEWGPHFWNEAPFGKLSLEAEVDSPF